MWDWFNVKYRTNNHVESWHSKFNKRVQVAHPVLFQFIELLQGEIEATMNSLVQKQKGEKVGRKNATYVRVDAKIREVMSEFDERSPLDYLRAIQYSLPCMNIDDVDSEDWPSKARLCDSPVVVSEAVTEAVSSEALSAWPNNRGANGVLVDDMPDAEILANPGEWLSDSIVTDVGNILESQFPKIMGFMAPLVFNHGFVDAPPSGKYIQVGMVGDNHFFCFSNVMAGADSDVTFVYDSLFWRLPNVVLDKIAHYHSRCSLDKVTIAYPRVKLQEPGSGACGLFSIAYAVALCFDIDPTTISFDASVLRDYVRRCMSRGIFEMFPHNFVIRKREPKRTVSVNYANGVRTFDVVDHC